MKRQTIATLLPVFAAAVLAGQIPISTPVGNGPAAQRPAAAPRAPRNARTTSKSTRAAHTRESHPAGSAEEELTQIENDWAQAQKAKDADKLSQILDDDWKGIGWSGKVSDKAAALASLKSAGDSLESIEMGPMDVRVIGGSVAIVTGSDTEKSRTDGKDSSGKYVWMDVFSRRGGAWKAIASQSTKVP